MIRSLSIAKVYPQRSGDPVIIYDALKFSRIYRSVPLVDIVKLFPEKQEVSDELKEKLRRFDG